MFNRGMAPGALAWSLMAGAAIQLSERVVLDLGYRFIDMGKAGSGRAGRDDLTAHLSKWGVCGFHFGG